MDIRWWVVLAAAATIGLPGVAAACDCSTPESWDYKLPEFGATGVPTNTRVFVPPSSIPWDGETPLFFWTDAAGVAVPFDVASLGEFTVLIPRGELAPETSYTAGAYGRGGLSFRTGSGPDRVPPAVPELVEVGEGEVSTGTSCGDEAYVPLEVRSDAELVLLAVGGPSDFDPVTFAGSVDEVKPGGEHVYFAIGEAACSPRHAAPGETTRIRLAAMDASGNLSPWTDPRRVEVPGFGCGCRSAGPGDIGLLALGLVVLGLRRR